MSNVIIVVTQVVIMFGLIGTGFLAVKVRWLKREGVRDLNSILLYVILPAVILNLLNTPYLPEHTTNLLIALALAVVCHLLAIIVSKFAFRRQAADRQAVLRSATVLSNSAFMAIPLVNALAGKTATLYLIPYLVVFYVVTWTFGVRIMEKSKTKPSLGKLLTNPTLIAVAVGLVIYAADLTLPGPVSDMIRLLSDTNAPFAMILIGAQIALMKPRIFPPKAVWLQILLRNILIPLAMLPIIMTVTDQPALIYATLIPAAAPTAATVVLFATRFDGDIRLAAETMAHSTIFSIISLTGITFLADWLIRL